MSGGVDLNQRRVLHAKDWVLEEQRSQLYEELRMLSLAELEVRADSTGSRQTLIALVIERECPRFSSN